MDKEKDTKRIVAIILVLIVILAIFIGIRSCSKPEEEIEPTPTPEVTPEPTPTPTPTPVPKPSTNTQPTTQDNSSTESTEVEATPVVNEVVVKPAEEEEPSYSKEELEELLSTSSVLSAGLTDTTDGDLQELANQLGAAISKGDELDIDEGATQEEIDATYKEIESLVKQVNEKIQVLEEEAKVAVAEAKRRVTTENVEAANEAIGKLPTASTQKEGLNTDVSTLDVTKVAYVNNYADLLQASQSKDVQTIYLDENIVIDHEIIKALKDAAESTIDFNNKQIKVDMNALPIGSKLEVAPTIQIDNSAEEDTSNDTLTIKNLVIETTGVGLEVYNTKGVTIEGLTVTGPKSTESEEVTNALIGLDVNASEVTLKGTVTFENVEVGVKVHKDQIGEVAPSQNAQLTIDSGATITNATETKEHATVVLVNEQGKEDNTVVANGKLPKSKKVEALEDEDVDTTYYYLTVDPDAEEVADGEIDSPMAEEDEVLPHANELGLETVLLEEEEVVDLEQVLPLETETLVIEEEVLDDTFEDEETLEVETTEEVLAPVPVEEETEVVEELPTTEE